MIIYSYFVRIKRNLWGLNLWSVSTICMCMFLHMSWMGAHVCLCICLWKCTHGAVWRIEPVIRCLPPLLSFVLLWLWEGSLTKSGAHSNKWAACQQRPGSACFLTPTPPSTGAQTHTTHHVWLFYGYWRSEFSSLCLLVKFYQLCHLPDL